MAGSSIRIVAVFHEYEEDGPSNRRRRATNDRAELAQDDVGVL